MAGSLKIFVDQRVGAGMQRHIARLTAFTRYFQVRHASAGVAEVSDLELRQFLAPQRVKEQRREDGPVALATDAVILRRIKQLARLVVAKSGRLAFSAFGFWPLHAFDGVVGDGVLAAKVLEQRGQGRKPMPYRAPAKTAPHELVAPSDDMRAGDSTELLGPLNASEPHEVAHRILIGPPGLWVGQVGEPFHLGRDVGEPVELGRGQKPRRRTTLGRQRHEMTLPGRAAT